MANTDDYHYSVAWNENEIQYWAQVAEFPRLSYFAPTREAALVGLRKLVADATTPTPDVSSPESIGKA